MDDRTNKFKVARRQIINELVEEYGENSIRTKAQDYSFRQHIDDLAWKQVRSESVRDLSADRLRRKKKIKHGKKATA